MIDYARQVFTGYYVQNGAKYCYTVYPEFYYYVTDGLLHYRDKANVIAITPYGGTICFALMYDEGEWKKIIPQPFVNNKLLKTINTNMKKVTEKNPLIRVIVDKIK